MRSTLFPAVLGVRAVLFLAAAACGLAQVPAASAFMDNGGKVWKFQLENGAEELEGPPTPRNGIRFSRMVGARRPSVA